jgi:hypothetical protein
MKTGITSELFVSFAKVTVVFFVKNRRVMRMTLRDEDD